MKLSSRKELLKEADEELKNIRLGINEVMPRVQNSPEIVDALKQCIQDYDTSCKKAIAEFQKSKRILEKMLNTIQSKGGIGEEELINNISKTWIEDYSSGVEGARSAIQRFKSYIDDIFG